MDETHLHPARISMELSGADITPQIFRKSVDCFFDIVDEVVRVFPSAQGQVRWAVSVSAGSANIHLTAHPQGDRFAPAKAHQLVGAIHDGIRMIESSSVKPPYFSDYALRRTKELASVVEGGIDFIDIGWIGRKTRVTRKSCDHIKSILRVAYKSWGSVDGILCVVSTRGRRKFLLHDDVTDKHIPCYFSAELLPMVLGYFGKRITAQGLISYRSDATMNSISVDHVTSFPETEPIPGFSDVYGLLSGAE